MTCVVFFFQAEDGIRAGRVTGVQTCALPILHDGTEDHRCDDHANEIDEGIAQGLHLRAKIGPRITKRRTRHHRDEHLEPELADETHDVRQTWPHPEKPCPASFDTRAASPLAPRDEDGRASRRMRSQTASCHFRAAMRSSLGPRRGYDMTRFGFSSF